jgi:hypothetical protein
VSLRGVFRGPKFCCKDEAHRTTIGQDAGFV